ncbi:MAG: hypothetical protein ACR2IF_10345 [Terriglobales bacterium]
MFSYVVARDYGFAPNPFYGFCTLATCKPKIREAATVGDWVIGTGSANYSLQGRLVYAMRVTEVLTFDQYWDDPRFHKKKPNLHGSIKQAYGDNIYHRQTKSGRWLQEDSHHSHPDGCPNKSNIEHDTQTPRVLISDDFVYFGGGGPRIPQTFRNHGHDLCAVRGHKCIFPETFVLKVIDWVHSLNHKGFVMSPAEFH